MLRSTRALYEKDTKAIGSAHTVHFTYKGQSTELAALEIAAAQVQADSVFVLR